MLMLGGRLNIISIISLCWRWTMLGNAHYTRNCNAWRTSAKHFIEMFVRYYTLVNWMNSMIRFIEQDAQYGHMPIIAFSMFHVSNGLRFSSAEMIVRRTKWIECFWFTVILRLTFRLCTIFNFIVNPDSHALIEVSSASNKTEHQIRYDKFYLTINWRNIIYCKFGSKTVNVSNNNTIIIKQS